MVRFAVFAALVVAGLVYAHDHQLLSESHLMGGCTAVQLATAAPDGSEWRACTDGALTGGAPDLSARCTDAGTLNGRKLWKCPEGSITPAVQQTKHI
jgi:hypothetical protein